MSTSQSAVTLGGWGVKALRHVWHIPLLDKLVSDIAIFVLKRDVKLQLTNLWINVWVAGKTV